MRFLTNGSHRDNGKGLLQLSLGISLAFTVFFWATNVLLFVEKMGFSYQSIVEYYLGNEEKFKTPVSYMGLLETTHSHLFAFAMLLLFLNHLIIFVDITRSMKIILILGSSLSALGDILSGWFIVYVSPVFAFLKISSFVVLQLSISLLLVFILKSIFIVSDKRETPSDTET